jgi:hypothetical protein
MRAFTIGCENETRSRAATARIRYNHSLQEREVTMLAYLFVILTIVVHLRFIALPFAFTPVTGSLLFFGARGSRKYMWVPVVLLAASDVILTRYVYVSRFSWDHLVTWAWYAAMVWLGTRLRDHQRPLPVLGAALAGSVSFFVISNFAAWAAWSDMYPKTFAGLMTAYAAGIPFFRRALEGDLLFTALMFATPVALHMLSGANERRAAV